MFHVLISLCVCVCVCVCVVFQMIASSPLLASNPELQEQMIQMMPTMLERVCRSCFSCHIFVAIAAQVDVFWLMNAGVNVVSFY